MAIFKAKGVEVVTVNYSLPVGEELTQLLANCLGAAGIIIPGSPVLIDPAYYGEPPPRAPDEGGAAEPILQYLENVDWIARLVQKARGKGMPVLEMCMGSWLLNVASGGTVAQLPPSLVIHGQDPRDGRVVHRVNIAPGTRLSDVKTGEGDCGGARSSSPMIRRFLPIAIPLAGRVFPTPGNKDASFFTYCLTQAN